jgi:hypothetical protein
MGRVPDVEVVRWPAEAVRRDELAQRRQPRLLLVAEEELPPPLARDEDWARITAPERDVEARRQSDPPPNVGTSCHASMSQP